MLSSLNAVISTNESTQVITGHVIYNPAHTYKFQLKTTIVSYNLRVFFLPPQFLLHRFLASLFDLRSLIW